MEDKRLLRLIKKARRGNKDAFCQLIEEKGRKIVFIATNLMGNNADGEDAAQEAVITLAQKIGTLKKAELFDAWMYRIVFNVCMDEKRRKSKKLDVSGELDVAVATVAESDAAVIPEENLDNAIDQEEIMSVINALPERYRMCILLYYYEDMSYAEIAETLQVSEQVVANTLNRAKEKIRVGLESSSASLAALSTFEDSEAEFVAEGTKEDESKRKAHIPNVAIKAGAFLPAAVIAQAISANEAMMVSTTAVSNLTSVAAGVAMPSGLFLSHLIDSVTPKVVAGVTTVAIATGAAAYTINQPVVNETPPPAREARIDGLPAGATDTILVQGRDDAQLAAFNQRSGEYEVLSVIEEDGYIYTLYEGKTDTLDYVLTVVPISS